MGTLYIYSGISDKSRLDYQTEYVYTLDLGKINMPGVCCLNDAVRFNDIALKERDDYASYVYSLNTFFLNEGFSYKNLFSTFFLSDLSCKRTELYETYSTICHIQLLIEKCVHKKIRTIILDGCTDAFYEAIKSVFPSCSFTIINPKKEVSRTALRKIVSAIKFFIYACFFSLLARCICRQSDEEKIIPRLFFSIYPLHLTDDRVDIKFNHFVDAHDTFLIGYLMDGCAQPIFLRKAITYYKRLASMRKTFVLDSYVRLRDCITYLFRAFQYIRKERRIYRENFSFKDIQISKYVHCEVENSCMRIPRLLMYGPAIHDIFSNRNISEFIYYLFEYPWGRNISAWIQSLELKTRTVGFQHGPVARRKLVCHIAENEQSNVLTDLLKHAPIPHTVFAENELSKEIYKEAGYAHVAVMPEIYRVSYLKKIVRKKSDKESILVAPGLHDGMNLLCYMSKEILTCPGKTYVIKFHPKNEREVMHEKVRSLGFRNLVIGDEEISKYLGFINEVVCTYSSVGFEAYMLGIPVRVVLLPGRINESPLLDIEDPLISYQS